MTIEEEIRRRLRAMGMDEESIGPCISHIKADPLMRSLHGKWGCWTWQHGQKHLEAMWLSAKSSALDYLEQKYHIEAKKEN